MQKDFLTERTVPKRKVQSSALLSQEQAGPDKVSPRPREAVPDLGFPGLSSQAGRDRAPCCFRRLFQFQETLEPGPVALFGNPSSWKAEAKGSPV